MSFLFHKQLGSCEQSVFMTLLSFNLEEVNEITQDRNVLIDLVDSQPNMMIVNGALVAPARVEDGHYFLKNVRTYRNGRTNLEQTIRSIVDDNKLLSGLGAQLLRKVFLSMNNPIDNSGPFIGEIPLYPRIHGDMSSIIDRMRCDRDGLMDMAINACVIFYIDIGGGMGHFVALEEAPDADPGVDGGLWYYADSITTGATNRVPAALTRRQLDHDLHMKSVCNADCRNLYAFKFPKNESERIECIRTAFANMDEHIYRIMELFGIQDIIPPERQITMLATKVTHDDAVAELVSADAFSGNLFQGPPML